MNSWPFRVPGMNSLLLSALSSTRQLLFASKIEMQLLNSWGHLAMLDSFVVYRLYSWKELVIAFLPWKLIQHHTWIFHLDSGERTRVFLAYEANTLPPEISW